jgi:hypothetical protein
MKKLLISLIGILFFGLVGCTTTTEAKRYADFTHMDHWDQLNDLTDEETLLYYYSPYCAISKSIEVAVSEAFVRLENAGVPILLIHEGLIYEQGTQPLEIIETPSILVYENKTFQEIISGSIPVLTYLDAKLEALDD